MPYVQQRAFDYEVPLDARKVVVQDGEAFERALRRLQDAPIVGFDFETSGLAWYRHARACGIALGAIDADGGVDACYVPVRHREGPQLDMERIRPALDALLRDPAKLKVAHNIKFDEHIARKEGLRIEGPRYCTMVAARIYDENELAGLKHRAVKDLGEKDAATWEKHMSYQVTQLAKPYGCGIRKYLDAYGYSEVPIAICGRYACFDIDYTLRLHRLYEPPSGDGLTDKHPRVMGVEMPLTEVLADMEQAGMRIDVEYLQGLAATLNQRLGEIEAGVWQAFPHAKKFSLSNDNALRRFLMNDLGLPLFKKTKSQDQFSVARDVLEHFAENVPELQRISDWRDAQKISTTYTESLLNKTDSQDFIHCEYQQVGAGTGRLSCTGPNLQNVCSDSNARAQAHSGKSLEDGGVDPWSVRRAFTMREKGWVRVFADYSQIELRVLAWYTKDPILLDSYLQNEDVHSRTSREVFGSEDPSFRRAAKAINFGITYGLSPIGLSKQIRVSEPVAEEYMRKYLERYAGVPAFRTKFWRYATRQGGRFTNLWGRPRFVAKLLSRDRYDVERGKRMSFGSLIQGTAAELTKESLVRIAQYLRSHNSPALIVNTVHDEIAIDMPAECMPDLVAAQKYLMELYPEFLPVPILVETKAVSDSWAGAYSSAAKLAA